MGSRMAAINPHDITKEFEKALCDYTGAPYAVAVDNCSNALFLALKYHYPRTQRRFIHIPSHSYPSVPCEIIHAGFTVAFDPSPEYLTGKYVLSGTPIWDCALEFTRNMYLPQSFMCLSFTGPFKHLKLGKGGAILTDDPEAYKWFKKARFSGRNECSYLEDDFTMTGWNFYMMPEISARGLQMMSQFYNEDGTKKHNPPISHRYPDLSQFKIYGG